MLSYCCYYAFPNLAHPHPEPQMPSATHGFSRLEFRVYESFLGELRNDFLIFGYYNP